MSDRSSAQLRAIIRTQTEIVAGDLDPEAVMQLIAERAQELTRARAGVIELAEGEEMVYAVTSGEATPYLGTRLQKRTSLSGRSVTEGRVLRSDDTREDDRVDAEACRRVDAGSMICVPLAHRGEAVGVLKVYAPQPHHFDDDDVETLELLSELIAAQLSHANLYEAELREGRRDALTGLPNRRAFEERLPVELARASRTGQPLALCLLDLDGFKGVNDRLGHPAGDEVLRAVAQILDASRVADDCFRIGGDEFAIVMPETTAEEARLAVERIAAEVGAARLVEGVIGVSFGVAAGVDRESEALIAAADDELLAVKDRLYGRSSVCVSEKPPQPVTAIKLQRMGEDPALAAYEAFASIYNEFNHQNDYEMWLGRTLLPELEKHGLQHGRALDVGCGTGRAFAPLLQRGWQVHGCDLSPAMLERAQQEAGGEVEVEVADMRELPVFGQFELVLSLNDSVNYLLGDDDLERTLTGMRANLTPNGLLLFDVNAKSTYETGAWSPNGRRTVEYQGRRWTWNPLGEVSPNTFETHIEGDDVQTGTHRERFRPEPEIRKAMTAAGLTPLSVLSMTEINNQIVLNDPPDEEHDYKVVYIGTKAG